jgi:LmbE family N-acetylglucosaminyl deacetylase
VKGSARPVPPPAVRASLSCTLSAAACGTAEELQRLHPDALITWGPDGATGHPDHRLVSSIVTQLVRAGAPGVPKRLFYSSLPIQGMRAMNPSRGEPPLLIPQAKYFTVRVPFAAACHRTQFSEDKVRRVTEASRQAWNGVLPLAPWFSASTGTDLFTSSR